tara:strand:- start:1135 stop:1431 length:297 start_codon:yes stop_codon:yes gene_type:complete
LPVSWTVEFTEKYALPGPKNELPVLYENRFRISEKARFHMRCGIPFHMPIVAVFEGDNLVYYLKNVVNDHRVCVLIDCDGGGGMGHIEMTDPIRYSCL